MEQELLIEARKPKDLDTGSPDQNQVSLRPWLLLGSVAAVFCLQLEVALLEQIDSLTQYMTLPEIALDAGVALLIVLAMAGAWWLCVLLVAGATQLVPLTKSQRNALGWYFGLLVPFSYLAISLIGAAKTLINLRLQVRWLAALVVLGVWLICILKVRVPQVQNFCRTRLAPVAGVHVAIGVIAVGALWAHGVHFFHNYQHSAQRSAIAPLPDVYLITFDALAAEDMSLYDYHLSTTPNLDRFARQSFTFDNFFANSNFTSACTTAIETGKLPWSSRVFHQGGFLRGSAQGENLAAELRRRGYYTAMITSNQWAAPFRHRTSDSYDAVDYEVELGTMGAMYRSTNLVSVNTLYTIYGALLRRVASLLTEADARLWPNRYPAPAEPVFEQAQTLLENTHISQPRFVWTHILPPHDPYLPPPPAKQHFLSGDRLTRASELIASGGSGLPPSATVAEFRGRYDEMVLYADEVAGSYLDWLQRTGRLEHAIVIISSDHGESFEHGTFLHGGPTLYDSMIHVPLLIHLPGQKDAVRVSQIAQQADLLPTILDLTGAPVPSWTDGVSLKPAMEGRALPERYIYSMNLEAARIFDPISKGTLSVRDEDFKYVIRLGKREESLYRYKEDVLEERNLITSDPGAAEHLRDVLFDKLRQVNQQPELRP